MCSIEGCDVQREFARGWCRKHWNYWRRYGTPETGRQLHGDDRARLLQYFTQGDPDACWIWQGEINRNGYGRTSQRSRKTYAHRLVYTVFVGPIPEGFDIDHDCHNRDDSCEGGWECPHRACVNPAHLTPRTKKANRGAANLRRVAASSRSTGGGL